MAFNLPSFGRSLAVIQPESFGGVMGGFTGPADILRTSAPFTAGLEAKKSRDMGLASQGLADAASLERTDKVNDVTLKVAKMREKGGSRINNRAALATLLANSPSLSQGFAGQAFGVGEEGTATQRMTAELASQNNYADELWRQRQHTLRWQQGTVGQAGAMINSLPRPPAVGG